MSTLSTPSPRLQHYFQEYQSFHQDGRNKVVHLVGVPVLVLGLLGLLSYLRFGPSVLGDLLALDAGFTFCIIASLFYLWLDWSLGLPFSLVFIGFYICGRQLMLLNAWPLLGGMFLAGWILQIIGHSQFEKRSPAILKSVEHFLIGPLWIFARLIGYYP